MNLTDREALYALSLIFTPGLPGIDTLMEKYESPAELLNVILDGSDKFIPHQLTAAAKAFDTNFASEVIDYCDRHGIEIITRLDDGYPDIFNHVDCPPLAFYCLGDKSVLHEKSSFTIVGARKATPYSEEVAEAFAFSIAKEGHAIISGFANGVDSAAHRGALKAGGRTVAVLGCGIDYDYPRYSRRRRNDIAHSGAVISEYPPLTGADRSYFTIRNRLIAGLGKALLVVQADVKSGSINSANHAVSQGKDVFVIPPADIFDKIYEGQSVLIRDGGIPVFDPHDILMSI